jgi:NADH-quinone oxidoreductase subunit L
MMIACYKRLCSSIIFKRIMNQLIPLIPFLPFIGFIINGLFGRNLSKNLVGIIGSGSVLASFVLSLMCFNQVAASGPIQVSLYQFLAVDTLSVNFGFLVDHLSAWMMLIVTGMMTMGSGNSLPILTCLFSACYC